MIDRFFFGKGEGRRVDEVRKSFSGGSGMLDIFAEDRERDICLEVWVVEDNIREVEAKRSAE